MKKQFLILLLALATVLQVWADEPKREMRSVWFTTYVRIDWPSQVGTSSSVQAKQKQELINYLDNFDRRNFNGVCIQVRSLCDAMYKSTLEPWSVSISGTRGTDPGWDPLAFCIEECHKRGLECYAWVNPFRQRRQTSNFTTSFDKDWEKRGMLLTYGDYTVMDPAKEVSRQHILNVIKEIYTNYQIDGMLFDDYFYPNSIPEDSSAGDYNTWKSSGTSLSFGDWRRENINSFMRELYAQIAQDRPDMRFGLSPAGVAYLGGSKYGISKPKVNTSDWQYNTIYSDPIAWLADGSIDFISPQIYWHTTHSSAPYEPLAQWWSDVAHKFGRHFYSSQGSYRLGDLVPNDQTGWAEMAKQMEINRKYNHDNAPGSIWYSSKYFDGPTLTGLGQYLQNNVQTHKALMPVLQWKENPGYSAPADVKAAAGKLTWSAVTGKKSNSIIRYTVYAIPQSVSYPAAMAADGDGIKADYLLEVVYGTSYTIPTDYRKDYWYAVCTYDGYGYESAPATCEYSGSTEPQPGEFEPGYHAVTDPAAYLPVDKLSIENLWVRSVDEPYANISYDSDGALNRGMVISGDYVYVCGRKEVSATADIYLAKYDLLTGEHISDVRLDDAGKHSYLPCNDVILDSEGNICITNLVLNCSTTPGYIDLVDPATGKVTCVAEVTTPEKARVDHFGLYGDVTSGNFYVFAVQASGNQLYRWEVKNGKVGTCTAVAAKAYHPATATNFSIAPKVLPISATRAYVDGHATYPTIYDFTTGAIVSSFSTNADNQPASVSNNGMCTFTINNRHYLVHVSDDFNTDYGFRWNISHSGDNQHSLPHVACLWTVPEGSLGRVNSSTCSAPCSAVVKAAGTAIVALYAPGNGLAVYRITDGAAGSGVKTIDMPKSGWSLAGRSVNFGASTQARVCNMAGVEIMRTAASTVELPAAGAYIIVTPEESRIVVVR